MPIVCIGISHRTAPVGVRERFALSHDDQRALFSRLDFDQLRQQTGIAELAVLSTCNRTEIYGAAAEPGFRFDEVPLELLDILAGERGMARDGVRPHIRGFSGPEAVRHLCRVACGLDSMVLGESEVLGQVTAAHETAAEAGASGPLLEAVFQTAVRAGRRARAETGISRAPVSVSSVAVRAARDVVGDLADREILIVGTGKMGRLTGKFLRSNGASSLMVISRTRKHAEEVAARWGAEPLAWHDLSVAIARADIVFSSTAAPHAVITYELVRDAIGAAGRDRPLLFVDIAVPRDVEEEVRSLSNVRDRPEAVHGAPGAGREGHRPGGPGHRGGAANAQARPRHGGARRAELRLRDRGKACYVSLTARLRGPGPSPAPADPSRRRPTRR